MWHYPTKGTTSNNALATVEKSLFSPLVCLLEKHLRKAHEFVRSTEFVIIPIYTYVHMYKRA